MKTKLVVALLVGFSTSIAAPAFASGYGPAPSYRLATRPERANPRRRATGQLTRKRHMEAYSPSTPKQGTMPP
jgi:hypothetical protein